MARYYIATSLLNAKEHNRLCDALDSFQAARRCKICIDTENAIIEWRIRDRLSRLVGGI